MTEYFRAMAFDPNKCLDVLKMPSGSIQLDVTSASSPAELIKSVVVNEPDVVLLWLEKPGQSEWKLAKQLREVSPGAPVLLIAVEPKWAEIDNDPFLDVVSQPIDPDELKYRIAKLLHSIWKETKEPQYRLPNMAVESLRSDSGRIDARKVAELFGISIPVLAGSIGVGGQALYKTPDAPSVQPKLEEFERIAWGLLKIAGSPKGMKIWLNAANPELDNEFPIDYVKDGHVADIAAMVEDVLLGHPS